jgi:nitrogen regulatory protein P-II 1
MIIAFVQPFMAQNVVHALHTVPGVSGATFVSARGFGRGRAAGTAMDQEVLLGTAPRVRVEVMVPDSLEDVVVRAIREAAHTGRNGDGKVYVAPVQQAVRISTGEEGEAAV